MLSWSQTSMRLASLNTLFHCYIYIIIIIFILNNIFLCIKAVEHGNWGGSGSCAQRLCECDRSFAECLKRYPCPTTKAVCTSSPWRLVQNLFMIM